MANIIETGGGDNFISNIFKQAALRQMNEKTLKQKDEENDVTQVVNLAQTLIAHGQRREALQLLAANPKAVEHLGALGAYSPTPDEQLTDDRANAGREALQGPLRGTLSANIATDSKNDAVTQEALLEKDTGGMDGVKNFLALKRGDKMTADQSAKNTRADKKETFDEKDKTRKTDADVAQKGSQRVLNEQRTETERQRVTPGSGYETVQKDIRGDKKKSYTETQKQAIVDEKRAYLDMKEAERGKMKVQNQKKPNPIAIESWNQKHMKAKKAWAAAKAKKDSLLNDDAGDGAPVPVPAKKKVRVLDSKTGQFVEKEIDG